MVPCPDPMPPAPRTIPWYSAHEEIVALLPPARPAIVGITGPVASGKSTLAALRAGLEADIPVWSFQTHRRDGSRRIAPAPLIILEGIHALHDTIAHHLDLRIFVDAPRDTRWRRWERVERSGQRGM